MHKQHTRPTARVLSVILVLALLVLSTSLASAQPRAVSTLFTELAKLTASDAAEMDAFGNAVSISGDTLIVGVYGDDDNGDFSGSAYLFEKPETSWLDMTETVKLTPADGAELDRFGHSVSISGDTVVVGAFSDDDKGDQSGSAYVFERDAGGAGNWGQVAKLTASDGAEGDSFGLSVSISGDTIVVGAPGDDDSGYSSGLAYLFVKPQSGWLDMTETAKLAASDAAMDTQLGYTVSVSGEVVVLGARGAANSGSVYLYEKPVSGWTSTTETAKLTASDAAADDYFADGVSISGDTVVVGAYGDDDNGDQSGSAYMFEKPVSGWTNMTETAKLSASDGAADDRFGFSVSTSGDMVLVGAWGDDDVGDRSGSAYLFEKPETGWDDMTETAKATASDGAANDFFGYSLSLSNGTAVISGHGNDDDGYNSGSAYVFFAFNPVTSVYLPVVLRAAP